MSKIVKSNTLHNKAMDYRYAESEIDTVSYSSIAHSGLLTLVCRVYSAIGVGMAAFSTVEPEMLIPGLATAVAAGAASKVASFYERNDTVTRYILGIDKNDAKQIAKACRKKNRGDHIGTFLEASKRNGKGGYRIKFNKDELEVTDYELATPQQAWDNQMEMFKSAYGLNKPVEALTTETTTV